jgi:hypothetical protein
VLAQDANENEKENNTLLASKTYQFCHQMDSNHDIHLS